MILDNNLRFGSTGTITSAGTYVCADVVNFQANTAYSATASGSLYTVAQGTQNREMGAGENLFVYFTVTTALAGGTNATFQAVASSSATLASGNIVVGEVSLITTANLGVGQQIAVRVSPQLLGSTGLQYLGAQVITTGTHTAGAIIADLVMDMQDGKRNYASGFTIV